MNILMVSTWSPLIPAGGVSTMMRDLIRNLRPECHAIVLVSDWDAPVPTPAPKGEFEAINFRLRNTVVKGRTLKSLLAFLLFLPITILRLRRLCKERNIEAIHMHFVNASYVYFPILKWLLGIPLVTTLHRGEVLGYSELTSLEKASVDFVNRHTDHKIAVSEFMRDTAAEAFSREDISTIPNGIDVGNVDANSRKVEPPVGKYLISVANVTYYKGTDVLIKAWSKLPASLKQEYALYIVGDGREFWDDCHQLLDELDCRGSVHMVGKQEYATSVSYLRGATAAVLPSRSEGLPYALLEAGALGIPVVCSDIPPYLEVITDGENGLIAPVDDAQAFSEAMRRYMEDAELASTVGGNFQNLINGRYHAKVMAGAYLEAYKSDDLRANPGQDDLRGTKPTA